LPVAPDERRTHLEDAVKVSGNTPHVRSELTSTSANASGIAPSLTPPPVSSVERLYSSSRYGPSTVGLPDTSRSQGKVGRSVDSELGKQETAHAPPPTTGSAGPHSTQDQPKPVVRAPGDNSSTVSGVGLRRRPSVGDTDIPPMRPPPHRESSGMSAPSISPEARAKRETDPAPTVISPSTKGDGTSVNKIGTALVDDAGHVQQSGESSIFSSSTRCLLTSSLPSVTHSITATHRNGDTT
jgi:hypothetical protein